VHARCDVSRDARSWGTAGCLLRGHAPWHDVSVHPQPAACIRKVQAELASACWHHAVTHAQS
jgi:hypothetical protein